VAAGGRYVNPELGARLVAADAEAARLAEEDPLSDREREVMRLLALGHTNKEIDQFHWPSSVIADGRSIARTSHRLSRDRRP
jgi:FixJ family two-component response regulator